MSNIQGFALGRILRSLSWIWSEGGVGMSLKTTKLWGIVLNVEIFCDA